MLWNAKNGSVPVGGTALDYVSFGYGNKNLILLPGLSEGLASVKGKALLLAAPHRLFFEKYTVWMFGRREEIPEGFSIRDMAEDQDAAMKRLGISPAAVVGVSMGGMVAQYLAADHPESVSALILAVTAPACGKMTESCLQRWRACAEKGDHKGLMIDTAENSYSPARLKSYRRLYPFLGFVGKPENYRRFLAFSDAIRRFDATGDAERIACPTLILGGEEDRTVGADGSRVLAEKIRGSEMYLYPGLGHAAFDEAKDFNGRILDFLDRSDTGRPEGGMNE